MLGVIVCDESRFRTIKSCVVAFGNAPGPDACYLGQRGLRTLPLRMPKHQENALLLAERLREHKHVQTVLHPAFKECAGMNSGKEILGGQAVCFRLCCLSGT